MQVGELEMKKKKKELRGVILFPDTFHPIQAPKCSLGVPEPIQRCRPSEAWIDVSHSLFWSESKTWIFLFLLLFVLCCCCCSSSNSLSSSISSSSFSSTFSLSASSSFPNSSQFSFRPPRCHSSSSYPPPTHRLPQKKNRSSRVSDKMQCVSWQLWLVRSTVGIVCAEWLDGWWWCW